MNEQPEQVPDQQQQTFLNAAALLPGLAPLPLPQQVQPVVEKQPRSPHQSSADETLCCWICHDDSVSISPLVNNVCDCKGTIGVVHQHCIDNWVFNKQQSACPSCNMTYFAQSMYDAASPPVPGHYFAQLFFITEHFITPMCANVLYLTAIAILRYAVLPLVYGSLFYSPLENVYGFEHYVILWWLEIEDFSAMVRGGQNPFPMQLQQFKSDEWYEWFLMWLFGILAATTVRQVASMYGEFLEYFGMENVFSSPKPEGKTFTRVDRAWRFVESARRRCGLPRVGLGFNKVITWHIIEFILVGIITVACRHRLFFFSGIAFLLSAAVTIRFSYPRKVLKEKKDRFSEPIAIRNEATITDINQWFLTYLYDIWLFSIILPLCGGIAFHLAVSPYFMITPAWYDLIINMQFQHLVFYWLIGSIALHIVIRIESVVVVPLFAPGVDLFFIRSVDLDNGDDTLGWDFVHCQVYDMDPLTVLGDFIRVGLCELFFVAMFIMWPIKATFAMRDIVFRDLNTIALPLVFSDTFNSWYSGNLWTPFALYFAVILIGIIGTCFAVFPLQRFAVIFLRPITDTLAVLAGLQGYLFDDDRRAIVDRWLSNGGSNEPLQLPGVPMDRMFVRRERWIENKHIPSFLRFRVFLFAVMFFSFCAVTLWIPFVLSSIMAISYAPTTIGMISVGFIGPFFVTDLRLFCTCAVQVVFLTFFVVVSVFVGITNVVMEMWEAFDVPTLSMEVYDHLYLIGRQVAAKPEPESQ